MRADTWRERDLGRGRGTVPASVGAVVRRTRFGLSAARWGEGVLLGVAALTSTLAALAVSGAALDRWDAWCVALVCMLLAGSAWIHEHRLAPLDVARILDRRLRHQGGLVTAFELEEQGLTSPLAELVVARVLRRLRVGEALRVLFPPLAIPVAAPLVGAGLLALALEHDRGPGAGAVDLTSLTQGMVAALEGVETRALDGGSGDESSSSLAPGETRRVVDAVQRAADVARRAELGLPGFDAAEATEARLAELDRELAALEAELSRVPRLRGALEEARNWIDAARMGLASAEDSSAAVTRPSGDGTMGPASKEGFQDVPGVQVEARSAAGEAGSGQEASGVADDGEASASLSNERARKEVGTLAETYWPSEYDGIVAGWIESRPSASNAEHK